MAASWGAALHLLDFVPPQFSLSFFLLLHMALVSEGFLLSPIKNRGIRTVSFLYEEHKWLCCTSCKIHCISALACVTDG